MKFTFSHRRIWFLLVCAGPVLIIFVILQTAKTNPASPSAQVAAPEIMLPQPPSGIPTSSTKTPAQPGGPQPTPMPPAPLSAQPSPLPRPGHFPGIAYIDHPEPPHPVTALKPGQDRTPLVIYPNPDSVGGFIAETDDTWAMATFPDGKKGPMIRRIKPSPAASPGQSSPGSPSQK